MMKSPLYGGHDPSALVEGFVAKVCDTYVVVYPKYDINDLTTKDSVTISLTEWRGADQPQGQQAVMLVNPMLYVRGWRAREAYPITTQRSQQ